MPEVRLPPFLAEPTWPEGTLPLAWLSADARGARWILSGDPQVALVAKRLFPGARSEGKGACSFPNTPRVLQDVAWLMQRYPIAAAEGHEMPFAAARRGAVAHAERRIVASVARTAPLGVRFKGTPRPYQEEALAFALANQRCLCADDPGLGKTIEAIMLLASGAGFPALVVPPSHLVTQWVEMLGAFLDTDGDGALRIADVRGRGTSREDVRRGRDQLPDADIIVMHYGLVASWRERLLAADVKTVIFDEISELRHHNTDKFSACSLVSSAATHVLGLSATPTYNYGDEMWAVMSVIDFQCLGPRDDFLREWCTAQGARHLVADPEALGAHLRREGLMIRRRKLEVQDQLPPKHRAVEMVDGDDGMFRERMREAVPMLRRFGAADRFERFTLSGRIGEQARRATGVAKAASAAAFIATLLQAGEPVVAFAYHHDVVDALVEALAAWNPRPYTGRETQKQKDAAKADFIEGRSQVIIVSLRATTGIDGFQHRARCAVFCELDWSPAIHTQGEDRLWRDGQDEPVMVYYLVSAVGSDPDMQAKLGLKIGQAKGILDDPFESEADRERDTETTRNFVASMIGRLGLEFGIEMGRPPSAADVDAVAA